MTSRHRCRMELTNDQPDHKATQDRKPTRDRKPTKNRKPTEGYTKATQATLAAKPGIEPRAQILAVWSRQFD